MPQPGWLELIRKLCDEYGIVMIMDEVKTGFRIAPGGAQEYFGVQGDLVTYAKAMGNGFPIAAIGGKEEVMASVGPGRTAHGGTYCGNVVGTAAADATLELIAEGGVLETVEARGKALMEGIHGILTDAGHPPPYPGRPGRCLASPLARRSRRTFAPGQAGPRSVHGDHDGLVRRGAMPDPDGGEPWFLCAALSEKDVEDTLNYFEEAVKEVKGS